MAILSALLIGVGIFLLSNGAGILAAGIAVVIAGAKMIRDS